ncbi:helix-hairpin-helix domain-containing protein [Microvirga sp. SYSU G3D207]|uniref:Helix-hairpin-helix domain-containing protein n=2 Tax=Microvirga arsenatis TaxID=2692265 RepID=A0ABW9YYN6_9HYPH|nr:helix-hairpin-helix domain-containing protein [Microvirga arsenatis]NBJ25523.1 helix-hairpin-helix domain-containing protein [Microvirga arsenatis]
MAGGLLALWLSSGSGGPPAEGMVVVAPPQTLAREQLAALPDPAARIQVADAQEFAPPSVSTPPGAPSPDAPAPVPEQSSTAQPQDAAAIGEPSPPPALDMSVTGAVTKQAALPEPAAPAPATVPVDLNTASLEQLNSLKGAGALGRAIVKGRPYKSVDDLVRKKVLRRPVYEKIKDQVTVR